MTDNEIIKALECCIEMQCTKCPMNYDDCEERDFDSLVKRAIQVFNRQQAEIERLTAEDEKYPFKCVAPFNSIVCSKSIKDYNHLIGSIWANAIKEFAGLVSAEINRALENNHKVKQERISKLIEQGVAYNDEFCHYCDGKIHALCGIGDFIQDLVKEMVGEE